MTLKISTLERVLSGMMISDRLWLKSIYESTRDVVEADGLVSSPAIVKLSDWMEIHRSVKNFIWFGMKAVCPALCSDALLAIDREIIAAVFPHCDGDVTPEVRRRLVSALDRVAWAGLGGDE